jgi:glutathione S-transferase
MRLHTYAASCNAYKVRLLLAQLRRDDVELVEHDIFAGATLTDAFARLNPARTVPVLELDDGWALPESGAILWFLAEGTPLLPDGPLARAEVMRWLLWEQTAVLVTIAGLRFRVQTGRWAPGDKPARARHAAALLVLALLDEHLAASASGWVVGNTYTIADIALYGYVHVADEAGLPLADFPAVVEWLARVACTPGYMNDVAPYGANASVLEGRSIYG